MRKLNDLTSIGLVQLSVGVLWVCSGYAKLAAGNFPQTLDKMLKFFASKNPYSWYVYLLNNYAIPNSLLMGYVVEWTEFLVGLGLLFASVWMLFKKQYSKVQIVLVSILLLAGIKMNVMYGLASSWTGVSTMYLNLLLIAIQLIILLNILSKWGSDEPKFLD